MKVEKMAAKMDAETAMTLVDELVLKMVVMMVA